MVEITRENHMQYDPIKLGAMLAMVINAWLASRRGK